MRRVDPSKPVLSYADRETDASFQCDGRMIYVYNRRSRLEAWLAWVVAAGMVALPFVRGHLPGRTWFIFDEPGIGGWLGMILYGLAVFCLIALGFEWSTIRVDLETGQVERTTRWGPFTGRATAALAAFERVVVKDLSDGDFVVELVGAARMEVVSHRGRMESRRMAQEFARWVSLPVDLGD